MTNQELLEKFSVPDAIRLLEKQFKTIPNRPMKPRLSSTTPSMEEIKVHTRLMEKYDVDMEVYTKECASIKPYNDQNDLKLIDFIKYAVPGFSKLSPQTQERVWYKAWEDGHSSGYFEVYLHLYELVGLFEDYI